jgi:hypothetical protein
VTDAATIHHERHPRVPSDSPDAVLAGIDVDQLDPVAEGRQRISPRAASDLLPSALAEVAADNENQGIPLWPGTGGTTDPDPTLRLVLWWGARTG